MRAGDRGAIQGLLGDDGRVWTGLAEDDHRDDRVEPTFDCAGNLRKVGQGYNVQWRAVQTTQPAVGSTSGITYLHRRMTFCLS